MKIRECVLLIILIIVLVFGITLALCISLVLNPVGGSFSEGKLVAARGVNLIELNKKCNCGIMGLDYKFNVFNREAMSSNSSDNHSDENHSGDNSEAKFRSLVGSDTVYDEFQHMRSLGFSENEIKARLGSISLGPEDIKPDAKPTRPHNVTTTTATTTTQPISPRNRDFVIDDELIESIWKAINAKRMNMTKVAEVVNKRSFPMEAPHCFVPTLKEEKPSEDNNYKRWKFHPYLISISYPKYLDDQDDVRFICSGVIIDKEHAVTGKNCVMNKLKPFLKIRSNSPYWSKDGLLHQVLEIFYTTTLALLKVNPYFKLDAVLTWNKTENESVAKNITTSAGWITESRKKFSKYSVVRWGQDCEDCKTVVADNGTKCKNILGDPLINGAGILIGVRSCENSYLKIGEIASVLDRFRINY